MTRTGVSLVGVAALAAVCAGGCFVARENVLLDERLPVEQIRGIRRGETTRQEILRKFGPPTAVARRGTTMAFPPPGSGCRGRADVASETFFELFSDGRTIRDAEIVYYYDASRRKGTGVLIVPVIGGGIHTEEAVVERLWVLIDESTGNVEDYAFRGAD